MCIHSCTLARWFSLVLEKIVKYHVETSGKCRWFAEPKIHLVFLPFPRIYLKQGIPKFFSKNWTLSSRPKHDNTFRCCRCCLDQFNIHTSKKHLESLVSTTYYNLPLELKSIASFTTFKSSLYHYIMFLFFMCSLCSCLNMEKHSRKWCADSKVGKIDRYISRAVVK